MSEKKPGEPKPHRCVVDFWHRGMRADLHEQRYRRDRYSHPAFYCPELLMSYGFDGGVNAEGAPTCGVVLVGENGVASVWRGEVPQA